MLKTTLCKGKVVAMACSRCFAKTVSPVSILFQPFCFFVKLLPCVRVRAFFKVSLIHWHALCIFPNVELFQCHPVCHSANGKLFQFLPSCPTCYAGLAAWAQTISRDLHFFCVLNHSNTVSHNVYHSPSMTDNCKAACSNPIHKTAGVAHRSLMHSWSLIHTDSVTRVRINVVGTEFTTNHKQEHKRVKHLGCKGV